MTTMKLRTISDSVLESEPTIRLEDIELRPVPFHIHRLGHC